MQGLGSAYVNLQQWYHDVHHIALYSFWIQLYHDLLLVHFYRKNIPVIAEIDFSNKKEVIVWYLQILELYIWQIV